MSKHDILQDLKRVAGDLGRAPSRDEYESLGKFKRIDIIFEFPTFDAALIACGLASQKAKVPPEFKKYEREVNHYDRKLTVGQKFDQEILPWIGKYDKQKDDVIMMVRSDDHAQWVDPFCDEVFWQVASRIQPDIINFAGDTVDFYQVSAHSRNPRRSMSMQSEIDFAVTHFFKKARQIVPNCQIDWLLGNHEHRLFRYLCDQAPALSTLRCLQFDTLFSLQEYEVNLVARPNFLNARTGKDMENYKVYNGAFAVTHGTSTGQHPAHAELQRWGISGVSGHVHRHTVARRKNLRGESVWHSNGAMCQLKSGEEYINDLVNWDQGFLIVHISKSGSVFTEYVDLSTGFACIGGVYYRRDKSGTVAQGQSTLGSPVI